MVAFHRDPGIKSDPEKSLQGPASFSVGYKRSFAIVGGKTIPRRRRSRHPGVTAKELTPKQLDSLRLTLVVLALVCVAALAPSIFQGKIPAQTDWVPFYAPWATGSPYLVHNPTGGDSFFVYLPDRLAALDQWRQGKVPLWNPYVSGGVPFLGMQTANPLDPLLVLMLLLPTGVALGLNYALLLFAAGFGLILFLRLQGLRSPPALAVAAVAFALNPYFIYWLESRVFLAGLAMLPLALWALETTLGETKTRRSAAILALCIGYASLAGTLQTIGLFLLVLVVRTIWLLAASRKEEAVLRAGGRGLIWFGGAIATGLAIGSLPLIAGIELFTHSVRFSGDSSYYANNNFLHWRALAMWFNPQVFGWPTENVYAVGAQFKRTIASSSGWGSLGVIPLWLALIALVRRAGPKRERVFWGGLAGATLLFLLLMFTPVYLLLRSAWSLIDSVDLLRGLIVVNLAGAVLVGWGANELLTMWNRREKRWWIGSLVLYLFLGTTILVIGRAGLAVSHSLFRDLLPFWIPVIVILTMGLLPFPRPGSSHWKVWVLCLFIGAELCRINFLYNTFSDKNTAYPNKRMIWNLKNRLGPPNYYRFLVPLHWRHFPPNTSSVFGLADVRGYSNVPISRYRLLLESAEQNNDLRNNPTLGNVRSPIYRMLGAAYVSAKKLGEPDLYTVVPGWSELLFQRNDTLPRAFLVHDVVTVPGEREMRVALSDTTFQPQARIYLEADAGPAPFVQPATGNETVIITGMEPDHVQIRVEVSAPAVLVLADTYYPGWRATVDGESARILPANWGLRGVGVDAGSHQIEFRYRPLWFWPGLLLTVLAVSLCLLGLFDRGRFRKRHP